MPIRDTRRRFLTKSRFKLAYECATKLAYAGKASYGNTKDDDPFLKALAEGGFQVGALAKLYFPGGTEVETLDHERAIEETNKLLSRPRVVIYEAALSIGNLFVRVDILEKIDDRISLYEVKAKSYDPETDRFYQKRSKEKKLVAEWEPYLYDIAFQAYVAEKALPKFQISSYLYLVNKRVEASVEGLNQNFLLRRSPTGFPKVEVKKQLSGGELGNELLTRLSVDDEVKHIQSIDYGNKSFSEWVEYLSRHYVDDRRIDTPVGNQCKSCEFRIDSEDKARGLKSGFDECWKHVLGSNPDKPLVLDLWDNRSSAKQIEAGTYLMTELTREDVAPEPREDGPGISRKERQWIQVEKVATADQTPYIDQDGLSSEMKRWKFPLHFIDFETAQAAIPFNAGRRPYELIAFQFSHHIVYDDGRVEHAGEYINRERGVFPNFDFIRALKKELDKDQGTIFRYAAHENTVLCRIHDQLSSSTLPKDETEELRAWIRSITKKKDDNKKEVLWEGPRNMVDMRDLVLRYYYHPRTEGSNSLKYVLPATLNQSSYLQEKYSKPIYGSERGIPSKNYRNKQWIHRDGDGHLLDPYKTLEPIFSTEEDRLINALYPETDVADGGGAMMAYARMQFTEMQEEETKRISQALLRYCELDTLAMVFLYEFWRSEVAALGKKRVA